MLRQLIFDPAGFFVILASPHREIRTSPLHTLLHQELSSAFVRLSSMVVQKQPFSFDAAYPRRSPRATQTSTNRLTCLGNRYVLQSQAPIATVSADVSSIISSSQTNELDGTKVNIVLAHANGFNKELYEPFIEQLLDDTPCIEAIFVHDVATQGASGLVNAQILGDEYCWTDSSRDILAMIHQLRANGLMSENPIVGIGHSMGGCQIVYASLNDHRLFSRVILMDPVIDEASRHKRAGTYVASLSARRRDRWPSRDDAREKFLKSAFYRSWDPSVFERWIENGLTETGNGDEVMLTTSVAQEVYSFMHFMPYSGHETPDQDAGTCTYRHLKYLEYPVHYLFGKESTTIMPELRERLLSETRSGTRDDLEGCGHLIAMENPKLAARYCAKYITEASREITRKEESIKSVKRHLTLTNEYKENLHQIVGKAKL